MVLSPDGPWIARLTGFDDSQVRSVVYWILDARQRWRSSTVLTSAPFEAPVEWWLGGNSGYEAVTAHVTLNSGRMLKDPGGWHWVDGRHANPGGTSAVRLNADGSAKASYQPALHMAVISSVEFWLRGSDGHWARGGTASHASNGMYSVDQIDGSRSPGWNGGDSALSVHVLWPNGTQFVDPVPWVWSNNFQPAPSPPPTPTPTPPLPAAVQPPPAAPARVPAAPVAPNDPYAAATAAGASAVCADGTWSFSQHRSGTCSYHGGVHWWTGNLGPAGPGAH